jgi:hypothetical protein
MKYLILAFVLLVQLPSFAIDLLVINDRNIKSRKMSILDMGFIAERLNADRVGLHLRCEVKVREIKQEKKFSTGTQIIEMLEIKFRSSNFLGNEQTAYFPVGTELKVQKKISQFAGSVEEFELQSDDLKNSRFIFQHDGGGQIVWMAYENDLTTIPCAMNN